MAKNTSLFLRIGEAKNLPAKDISGSSDPYCVVKVDNEQVARTATVWRTLCPFWGEEYTLHLPNGFHTLSIWVYDQDIISGDDLIGRTTLSKEYIQGSPKGVEQWLKLEAAEREREVQGDVHIEIGRYITSGQDVIKVKVIEARELPPKDLMGSADPYVRVTFLDTNLSTKTVRASRFPVWNEMVEFAVPNMDQETQESTTLVLDMFDWDRMGSDDYMGKIVFKFNELVPNQTFDQWFRLQPKHRRGSGSEDKRYNKNKHEEYEDLGTIRIRARLSEERILPSEYYKPLINVLMDSVSPAKHKMSGPTPLKMLQEVMTLDLMEVANTLVKLYLGQEKIVSFLDVICVEEIQNTSNPNTLFRGNSLATKSVDQFMKIVGMPYLHETLGPVINEIYTEHKLIELDPGRLEILRHSRRPSLKAMAKDKDVIELSTVTLLRYLENIRSRILSSIPRLPPIMRTVFKRLRQRIEERWPGSDHEDHKYVGISGFLFLRFFAPAILSPKLFSLEEHHPDARTSRTLTLVAKAVQNMGNLGSQLGLGKEQWMAPVHPFIKSSVKDIKLFIDKLVAVDEPTVILDSGRRRSVFHPSVTIKQGYLWKRRWDKIFFVNTFTFKKRYFWLKYDCISYAKKLTDQVRNNIPLNHIIGVERLDKQAFSRQNMGQIITKNSHGKMQVMYFQAKDINDLYSWISSIRKTIITNEVLLDMFHPGAYRFDKWSCCSRQGREAKGCSQTHSRVIIGDWRDPLDPDAEAQTIYSQLHQGRDQLRQKYSETQEAVRETVSETVKSMQQQERLRRSHEMLLPSTVDSTIGASLLQPPPSPVFLGITNDLQHAKLSKSTSFQDAQIASVAQLLDVIRDLERAHEVYESMEREHARNSLRGDGE